MIRSNQSEEDYLERILMISEEKGNVRSIDISHSLGYSKPSVCVAMAKLEEKDLIVFDHKTGNISLTEKGQKIAKNIYKRHKMLVSFFVSIGVDEKVASEDACKIEHDLSDETFNKLEEYLAKKD